MTFDPSAQPRAFAERTALSSADVRKLRAEVWGDGSVSVREAERLFAMNRSVEPSAEWTDFFIEAVSEYMLSQGEPRGYVTEDEATWLIRQINRGGRIETLAELELMVKLLEHAEYAPASLRRFALAMVEKIVASGEGPTRRRDDPAPGRIDDAEAGLIRRLIFAPSGDGPARVSAAEAALLFRLKDASLGKDNSTQWKLLFVQGIANHLIAEKRFLPTSSELLGPAPGEDDAADAPAEEGDVTAAERDWLKRLYDPHAKRDDFEQALLDFLAEEGTRAH